MIDVRLITMIPPAAAVTQAPSAQTVTTQGAAIVPQLPAGSMLSGFIVNRDAGGNPILRTEQGDFTFSSNLFLKIGSDVVIRIQNSGGQSSAHIVTVDGQPPELATTQSSFADEPEIIVGKQSQPATQQAQAQAAAGATTLPIPKVGQTISAIVITPALTPASAPAAAPATPPGTSLLLSVLSTGQPAAPANTPSPLAQLTPATPATAASTTAAPSALSSLLPSATQPVISSSESPITSPQSPPTTPPANPSGQALPFTTSNQQAATAQFSGPLGHTITATVVATHPDGSVTLATPLGDLRAAEIGGLPPGRQLTLRISSVASPNSYTVAVANTAPATPPAPLTELSRTWTSLQQIVQALGADEAAKIIPTFPTGANFTPDMPGRITQSASQILFFIGALRGGNFRDWLGAGNIKSLEEKGYGSLVRKAEGEFMSIAKQFAEPQPANWQSTFFPVMAGTELQQVRAFIKREKKKNEQGKPTGDEDTRFVVEMELSQLGEMQMDGLVKRRDEKLQFDLIIRSHESLPKALEQDIQAIFTSTAEATGYRGQLSFQAVYHFPLHPLEDTTPHVFDDVVV